MKGTLRITSFLTIIVALFIQYVYPLGVLDKRCDLDLFPKTYVIIREGKNGPVTASLEKQGVIDLRDKIRVLVCINGPVIIYSDVMVDSDDPSNVPGTLSHVVTHRPKETIRFFNGSFEIFNHKCMVVNRVSSSVLRGMEAKEMKPSIDSTVPVNGKKVTGIYLMTAHDGPIVPSPLRVMFNQVGFGYEVGSSENVISDASFAIIGKDPHCLTLKDSGAKVVFVSPAQDEFEICRWTLAKNEKPNKDYKLTFQRRHYVDNYEWDFCPPGIVTAADPSLPSSSGNASVVPQVPANGTGASSGSSPFALLDPAKVTPHGSRKGGKLSGGDDPNYVLQDPDNKPCSSNPGDPACTGVANFPGSNEDVDGDPPTIQIINLNNCLPLPKFDSTDSVCNSLKTSGDSDCEDLSVALELDVDPSASTKPLTLESHPKLVWKHDVLTLIATIFSKICLPIRQQSVFQVMRIFDHYVASAFTGDPDSSAYSNLVEKSHTWDILISSLTRCKDSNITSPMEWTWLEAPTSGKGPTVPKRRKRELEIETALNDIVLEESDEEQVGGKKLVIPRAASVFRHEDQVKYRSEPVPARIPRWKRQPSPADIPIPFIQEYFPPKKEPPTEEEKQGNYDDFMIHPDPKVLRIKDFPNKQIFYYEEVAEFELEFNLVIDTWWKILASVMGYCQMHEKSRESGLYPLLFHNFNEYFLSLVKDKWITSSPSGEELLLGEFLDEDRSRWLDTCLETSYIVSDTIHFRPTRPLDLDSGGGSGKANAMSFLQSGFVEMPEDYIPGIQYFTRRNTLQQLTNKG